MGAVVEHLTDGVRATSCRTGTGIGTLIPDTSLMIRAVSVRTTSDLTEVMFANLPVEAFLVTVTLNVTTVVNAAFIESAVLVGAAGEATVAQEAEVSWSALSSG